MTQNHSSSQRLHKQIICANAPQRFLRKHSNSKLHIDDVSDCIQSTFEIDVLLPCLDPCHLPIEMATFYDINQARHNMLIGDKPWTSWIDIRLGLIGIQRVIYDAGAFRLFHAICSTYYIAGNLRILLGDFK